MGAVKPGRKLMDLTLNLPDGSTLQRELLQGELFLVPATYDDHVKAVLRPVKGIDVGAGKGQEVHTELRGGVVGLIIDGRGRQPFALPEDATRIAKLREWSAATAEYPESEVTQGAAG